MFSFVLPPLTLVAPAPAPAPAAGGATTAEASGQFDVKVAPNGAATGAVGLLTITKTYHGQLDAIGSGQMLGVGEPSSGTASYVAIEQVSGTLAGRKGGFVLQHNGWMNAGKQALTVAIAPGSGTGALTGIVGRMEIVIAADGSHRYVLRYTFAR